MKKNNQFDKIELTEKEKKSIKNKLIAKTITDKILESTTVGKLIKTAIDWNDEVNEKINAEKKETLLSQYFEKVDNNVLAIENLICFLSDSFGNTLIHKIFNSIESSPPDRILISNFANILYTMINSDYHKLYDKHKFALILFEKLSVQSFSIILNHKFWPNIRGKYPRSHGKFTRPWHDDFSKGYCKKIGITDSEIISRLGFNVLELINYGIIEDEDGKVQFTDIGKELLGYLE